jgi:hypothetical protein
VLHDVAQALLHDSIEAEGNVRGEKSGDSLMFEPYVKPIEVK